MKSSEQNHTKQVKLFFKSPILPSKPTVSLFPLPEDTQPRRINHMAKFKPFHEFQKPLIGFTPESFPHLHEDKFRLYRNGTTQRPSLQGSQTCPRVNGERQRDANGITKFTKGQNVAHVRNGHYVRSRRRENY